jgi:hypothetical protein
MDWSVFFFYVSKVFRVIKFEECDMLKDLDELGYDRG